MKINWLKLAASVLLCELTGILASLATVSSIPTWYAALSKPSFSPPNSVFGPVWTILYLLMGIAFYMVWQEGTARLAVKRALASFGVQLALNLTWTLVFFGFKNPFLAFFNILLLDGAIVWTFLEFNKVSKNAALLLVPYALWTMFATVLNFFIWRMNG